MLDTDTTETYEAEAYEVDADLEAANVAPDTYEIYEPAAHRLAAPQRILAIVIAVLLFAALGVSVYEMHSQQSKINSLNQRSGLFSSAVTAADQYGVYLSSYDYRNLSGPTASWTEVDTHSTAAFRKDFDSTKTSLTSLIQDYKATAVGTVSAAGVSNVTAQRAVVLVFVDQTVTNSTQKTGPQKQPYRLQLTLVRQGGQWLIDAVQAS